MRLSAILPALVLTAGCAPSPPAPAPPATAVPVATAAPAPSASAAAPRDTSLCHFAHGVTPSDPARVCDPCTLAPASPGGARRASVFHLEISGFMAGTMELDVDPQGMATWSKRAMDPAAKAKTWQLQLSAEQLATLDRMVAERHLCDQRSDRFGIPDESTILLSACSASVRCEVMLWQGEWDERPGTKAALAVIDSIIDDVVKRGAPR